jgi:hypothetical protein
MVRQNKIPIPVTSFWRLLRKTFMRHEFPSVAPDFLKTNRVWILWGIGLFLLALALRSWENLIYPGLYVEDATTYFGRYYGGHEPFSTVFNTSRGYIHLVNSVVAWMVAKADVRYQPGFYLFFAVGCGVVTSLNLSISGLFKNKWVLLILPLVLGLTGINHMVHYNTLIYQIYTLVVLLLCMLFFPAPRTNCGYIMISVLLCVLPWVGPYSVLTIPMALLLMLFFKGKRKSYLLIIAIISTTFYFFTIKGGTTRLDLIFSEITRTNYFTVLFEEIFFMGLLGELSALKVGTFLTGLFALLFIERNDTEYIKISIAILAITVCALFPFFLSKKFALYRHYNLCHLFISLFFWLVFLLYTMDNLMRKKGMKPFGILLGIVLLLSVGLDNFPPEKKRMPLNTELPDFLDTIRHYEQLNLEQKGISIELTTPSPTTDIFKPVVIVGRKKPGSRRVGSDFFEQPYGKRFIVEPEIGLNRNRP